MTPAPHGIPLRAARRLAYTRAPSMMRIAWHAFVIVAATLVFGLLAIVFILLIPTGDPLLWFARPWAATITGACGVRIRATGVERVPRGAPCVFLSNHQSHFDILALIRSLPGQYRVLAKRELFFIPVFGWAIWLAGFVPVDRSRRDRAIRSIDRAAGKVRGGRSVLIFGEGTRSEDGSLGPLKKGGFHLAMKSGAPIVPVCITGSRDVLPKGGRDIRPGEIHVEILPPIPTAGRNAGAIDGLIDEVRRSMLSSLASRSPVAPHAT